jgi:hypothetical protein
MCGPEWPEHGPKTRISRNLESSKSIVLQRFSCMERVTGIEPALSAWEEFVSHHVLVCCNGFGGLTWPLLTPTGLVVWPVCGPVLSFRVLRTAHWPKLPGRGSPRPSRASHYQGCETVTLSVLTPLSRRILRAGPTRNVPSRFRRRPPAPGTNRRGFRLRSRGKQLKARAR